MKSCDRSISYLKRINISYADKLKNLQWHPVTCNSTSELFSLVFRDFLIWFHCLLSYFSLSRAMRMFFSPIAYYYLTHIFKKKTLTELLLCARHCITHWGKAVVRYQSWHLPFLHGSIWRDRHLNNSTHHCLFHQNSNKCCKEGRGAKGVLEETPI